MQFDTLCLLPRDMTEVLYQIYDDTRGYGIFTDTTYQLINKYIHYNFCPIVTQDKYRTYCYLFTLDGNYIHKFQNIQDAENYITQEISKMKSNNHLSTNA